MVGRRRVAFDPHRPAGGPGTCLDGGDDLEIILQPLDRRHEDADDAVAHLDRQRRAHGAFDMALLLHVLARGAAVLRRGGGDGLRRWIGQRRAGLERILRHDVRVGARRDVGQRADRQAEADGRIAGNEVEMAAPERPALALPALAPVRGVPALHGQDEAGRLVEAALEDPHHAGALLGIGELRIARLDVDGQVALLQDPVRRILVGGQDVVGGDAEALGDAFRDFGGVLRSRPGAGSVSGAMQRRVAPERLAVPPPVEREGPARQALARDTTCPGR